ncbi:MAG: hypothetical protein AAFR91_08335 [Pseudomonadota bacterium]
MLESIAIFLSVLLAFFVEQWREDINEAKDAEVALSLVRAELAQNLAELERIAPSRPELLLAYQEAIQSLIREQQFPQDLPRTVPPEITIVAYELATDSGAIASVKAADLLVIASAYEALEKVRRNEIFLENRNAQIRFNDGEQYLSGFIYYFNRAMGNEPRAIAKVREALALLDSRATSQ